MRIALTTALMMVATIAFADEPSSGTESRGNRSPAAQRSEARPRSGRASSPRPKLPPRPAQEDDKPFKPPAGYRAKRVNGDQVYCMKIVVLGSRFPKEDCRTEAQLRDLEAQRASMRNEMDQTITSALAQRRLRAPDTSC